MSEPKILVVGDLMIDHYIFGDCFKISPEAPVQILNTKKEEKKLGGAGNVLRNLAELGARLGIISVLGNDKVAAEIDKLLDELKLDYKKIFTQEEKITSIKTRVIASNQQILRIDSENVVRFDEEMAIIMEFAKVIKEFDCVILSDYAKGVLSKEVCVALIKIANKENIPILVDPKGDYKKYNFATLLTPNKKEASEASGIDIKDDKSLEDALKILKNQFNLKYSIITLSEDGLAFLDESEKVIKLKTRAKEIYDVTGAGDTLISTLAYCIAKKYSILDALNLANIAAAVVVGKVGSATASWIEIEKLANSNLNFKDKIKSIDELEEILIELNNKKIVFTNGCFDILHFGHISYLADAKKLGDVLIVGLNSDESIKRLKGNDRPINEFKYRALMLSALEFVDFVVGFSEDTPLNLIQKIRPDILVKGSDYENKEVIGSNIAKKVVLLPFIKGLSTSEIIQKIKDQK